MNLLLVILSIIAILFSVFWAWFKLKDAEEGDLIHIGLGIHMEHDMFQLRVLLAVVICCVALWVGLVS